MLEYDYAEEDDILFTNEDGDDCGWLTGPLHDALIFQNVDLATLDKEPRTEIRGNMFKETPGLDAIGMLLI